MERNKRQRGLAKSYGDSLNALDSALKLFVTEPQREDEFTVKDLVDKISKSGETLSFAAVASKMNRLIEEGVYTSRKIKIRDRWVNVYREKR